MGREQYHCHGDEKRFEVLAKFIYDTYGSSIKYIADVAGGQGVLTRILTKKYHYESEVIDPRGWVLKGIRNRKCEFHEDMADYYDLIVGLHPDEATRPVAQSALKRPVIIIPCCNFWSKEKLGRDELIKAIEDFYVQNNIIYKKIVFGFKGPKNIGLVSKPCEI